MKYKLIISLIMRFMIKKLIKETHKSFFVLENKTEYSHRSKKKRKKRKKKETSVCDYDCGHTNVHSSHQNCHCFGEN